MSRRILLATALLTAAISTPARADFWGDAWKVVTAPVTAPIRVIQGQPPESVIRQDIYNHGRVLSQSVDAVERVHQQISNIPRDVVRNNLGNDWLAAYDGLTGDQRIAQEMAFTSGRFLGSCLQGAPCNLNQLVGMPLAAILRQSYKVYIGQSRSFSPQVQSVLGRVYPPQLLGFARIAIGNIPNFTAPGFLNAGNKAFGNDHAVTIGNLIIFSREPDLQSADDWVWVLHELHHVEQYASFSPDVLESIDGFSVQYIQYSGNMEQQAQATALQRFAALQQSCQMMPGC